MSRKPTRKKTRNQPRAPVTDGRKRAERREAQPDQADGRVQRHLGDGQAGVADHLAGEQLAHRDLGRDDLDDARLLLLDDAAREGHAERDRGQVEEERQGEGHALGEVALVGVADEHVGGQLAAAGHRGDGGPGRLGVLGRAVVSRTTVAVTSSRSLGTSSRPTSTQPSAPGVSQASASSSVSAARAAASSGTSTTRDAHLVVEVGGPVGHGLRHRRRRRRRDDVVGRRPARRARPARRRSPAIIARVSRVPTRKVRSTSLVAISRRATRVQAWRSRLGRARSSRRPGRRPAGSSCRAVGLPDGRHAVTSR